MPNALIPKICRALHFMQRVNRTDILRGLTEALAILEFLILMPPTAKLRRAQIVCSEFIKTTQEPSIFTLTEIILWDIIFTLTMEPERRFRKEYGILPLSMNLNFRRR